MHNVRREDLNALGLAVGVVAHRNTEWCSPPATEMTPVSLEPDLSDRPRGAEVTKPMSIQTETVMKLKEKT